MMLSPRPYNANRRKPDCRPNRSAWRGALCAAGLGLATASARPAAVRAEEPPPIQIILDLHMDPLNGFPLALRPTAYAAWRDAANWMLDVCDPRGAKISFLAVGEYMEYTLEDSAGGRPLMQRLYNSGRQLGTHSHTETRIGPHQWINLPGNAPMSDVIEAWNDHIGLADAVVTAALGLSDPAVIRAANCSRGSHIPADDAARIDLMRQYGFTIHQQGPDEQFYAYFKHYVLNTYRPSGANMLIHDPSGPVVISPTGTVLGLNQTHFGIVQDMRMPAHQARFLLQLLNWLNDAYIGQTGRVWTYGWAQHGSDILSGQPTRPLIEPMLDWLKTNFIDQPVAGRQAAVFSSSTASRDLYLAWETAHAGTVPFDYAPTATDWSAYPYLLPVARYLVDGQYVAANTIGSARLHRVTAAAAIGGPFDLYVAYPAGSSPVVVDAQSVVGASPLAAADPRTGLAPDISPAAVPIPPTGVILVPAIRRLALPNGDVNLDGRLNGLDIAPFVAVITGSDADSRRREASDLNLDGTPDALDLPEFVHRLLAS